MKTRNMTMLFLFILLSASMCAQEELHILFTGGIEGYILSKNTKEHGDVLRVKETIRALRAEQQLPAESTLVFDTGDALSYHYLSRYNRGESVVRTMVEAGYDGMTVGNLDFKFGQSYLGEIQEKFGLTLFAANVQKDGQPFLTSFKIFEKNGLKIGVIGFTDENLPQIISSQNAIGLKMLPISEALKGFVKKFRNECNLLIAVNHLSYKENAALARAVKGIDIYISKPTGKTDYYDLVVAEDNKIQSVVVEVPEYALAVGHLVVNLRKNDEKKEMESVKLQPFRPIAAIAKADLDLSAYESANQIFEQFMAAEFGDIDADAPLVTMPKNQFNNTFRDYILLMLLNSTKSEIAIVNDGFFKFHAADVVEGGVTPRVIEQIIWTDNAFVTMTLPGSTILKILDRGRKAFRPGQGSYLNFMAIRNYGDAKNRAFSVHNMSIDKNEMYRVVTTDFLAAGGNGYEEFTSGKEVLKNFSVSKKLHAKGIEEKGRPVAINSFLMHHLRHPGQRPEDSDWQRWISRHPFLNRALWQVNIENIDVAAQRVIVTNNENFTDVKDSRVKASTEDLTGLAARGQLEILRLSNALGWTNKLQIENTQTQLGEDDLEETNDNLEIESILDFYKLSLKLGTKNRANIFVSGRYDTEVTAPKNDDGSRNPRQQDIYLRSGVNFFGQYIQEFRLGFVGKNDRVADTWNAGLEANLKNTFKLAKRYPGQITLRGRYLFSNQDPLPGDEQAAIDLQGFFRFPIAKNLSFKPQWAYYIFFEKISKESARNLQLSLNLSWNFRWKPQY